MHRGEIIEVLWGEVVGVFDIVIQLFESLLRKLNNWFALSLTDLNSTGLSALV
jgi:hypothetical protein